ncbi:MAG: iron-sulfur cluster repair di-iron protein [Candidatus Hydrogenedentes bacterium]|nr:iron-sulfur cluster repair di-iron protein [Candidatus Hydrogenedentota bacterium]
MSTISVQNIVGEIIARRPMLAHAFEAAGVDYCCGGKKTLEEACREKGVDPQAFADRLEQSEAASEGEPLVDAAAMSLTELADHVEHTHHAYLSSELPRLDALTEKVASVHGGEDARLHDVRKTLLSLAAEMTSHMMKEEQILFPMIRRLEASEALPKFHCGSITNPVRQMEMEHHDAGAALERMRTLTDDYTPPDWACNTYRVMLDALARLEHDMHQHVHKEDNVLFPRAAKLEAELVERAKV